MNIINEQLIALVDGAKRKDSTAIEFLYNEFYNEVYYTCYKILGNQEDAKDITQDTFVEAFIGIDNLREPLSFKFWINRIATNKSFNFLKRMNKIDVQNPKDVEQLLEVEDVQARPEDIVIDEDVKNTLEIIMAKLPEEQRTTLFLFYYQEMTVKEIADLYQCAESTVRSRLAYARKFMRKEVEKFENEGYKLRCITALPFIFALFNAEKFTITAIGQGNIINILNSYISNIPTANANMINNFNTTQQAMQTQSINYQANLQPTNPQQQVQPIINSSVPLKETVSKVGKMSNITKIAMAVASVAVLAGGITLAAILINKDKQPETSNNNLGETQSSIVSEDNNSSKADNTSNIDTESNMSSEEIQEPATYIEWQFRYVAQPTFDNSQYNIVKPFTNVDLDVITATPEFKIDIEVVKNNLRNNTLLSSRFNFVEGENEEREFNDYNDVGSQVKYKHTDLLLGYEKGTDEYKRYSYDFQFDVSQTYSRYNTPEYYKFDIKTSELSQDDMYNIVKDIYGEELAEYMVYSDDGGKEEDSQTTNYLQVKIPTPDGNGIYTITRYVHKKTAESDYEIIFSLSFVDNTVTGNQSYGFDYYGNNYQPMEVPISLDEMFIGDLGDTDINNESTFFNKALNFYYNDEDKYTETKFSSSDTYNVTYLKHNDNTTVIYYTLKARRESKDLSYMFMPVLSLEFTAKKNADGSIEVEEFYLQLPTTWTNSSSNDAQKDIECNNLLSISRKQASYILGIDESEFATETEGPYAISHEIELFGNTVTADIAFDAGETIVDTYESMILIRYEN